LSNALDNAAQPVVCWRTTMWADDGQQPLWWNERGDLFLDAEMDEPAGLAIVSLVPPET
jgi:hypothetical protein